ncbi:MAG: 16S rRNA (guanine(966)-N(2))-methyltransferase RsmD [Kistimonas sp.]|nr:16S rRNA (guanine(966)-N(2))-methyltransferase RsmD [Kistimonas sp.]
MPPRSSAGKKCPSSRNASSRTEQGRLRIVGGGWRSRRLCIAAAEGLRPTPDRAREMVCNWLGGLFEGARCLDAFAGTGALGLEALSRGADCATFLELSSPACQTLRANLVELECTRAQVICTDALSWLTQYTGQPFDLVFLDPPFGKGFIASVSEQLHVSACLARDAVIYVESERDLPQALLPQRWKLWKEKAVGQVMCRLYHVV